MVDPIPPQGQKPDVPMPVPVSNRPSADADPTGVWQKFLSVGSNQATPEQVKLFLNSLLKMFGVLIDQDARAFKRSMQRLKEAQDD